MTNLDLIYLNSLPNYSNIIVDYNINYSRIMKKDK